VFNPANDIAEDALCIVFKLTLNLICTELAVEKKRWCQKIGKARTFALR